MTDPSPVLDVQLERGGDAESLVREFECRNLDSAKALGRDAVLVKADHTADGSPLVLEPLIALECWLADHDVHAVTVKLGPRIHNVRARRTAERPQA